MQKTMILAEQALGNSRKVPDSLPVQLNAQNDKHEEEGSVGAFEFRSLKEGGRETDND